MRIFKVAWFVRFARAEGITDELLAEAVARAEHGQVDARLGGEVIKQRIPRAGQGRSGGYRAVVIFRGGERAVYVYGYAKSERSNLRPDEVAHFKKLAIHVLTLSDAELAALLARGTIEEVSLDEREISE